MAEDTKSAPPATVENVTEKDVSKVTGKPWRTLPRLSAKDLQAEIENYCPLEGSSVTYVNILLIGSVGSGKSSYFNTMNSIFRGHVTGQACSGSAEHSLTTVFRRYKIRSTETKFPLKFRLCDTRGLEEDHGMNLADVVAILDGHVPDRYQFNPSMAIGPETASYRKNPTIQDKIHVIAFVIDGCSVDVFPEKILSEVKAVQEKANQRGIPQVVLLTKVDKVCQEVEENLLEMYCSQSIADLVDKTSQLIGLPRAHILPMKNYEKETELEENVNVAALLTIRQILRFADDFLWNIIDDD